LEHLAIDLHLNRLIVMLQLIRARSRHLNRDPSDARKSRRRIDDELRGEELACAVVLILRCKRVVQSEIPQLARLPGR
ncbi:hypothetical protein PMAYCL1PPCAC_14789, partial [Pristionchus mayeri]